MSARKKVVVIGAGSFGTAMAYVASRNSDVVLYARDAEQVKAMNETRRNPKHLTDCELPTNVRATADVADAFEGDCDLVILALPAQRCPDWLREHGKHLRKNVSLCSTAKGLYLPTKQLMSAALKDALPEKSFRYAVLSGPSFAAQIALEHPTAVVVASALLADAVEVQFLLSTPRFRVYASQDVVGVELGGALKNVLAIGAGLIEGSGFGINTKAAYVTRAARELSVLCTAMGGNSDTVSGLSGIGDLVLSAFGELSRNRTCGVRLAHGETLEAILAATTVEGVPTAQVAHDYARRCNLDLPLFAAVHAILAGTCTCEQALQSLMTRPLGTERPLL